MKYLVTEIQTFDTGAVSTPSYAYDNRASAEAKFYSILASAAVSALPRHAAILFTDEGYPIMHQSYTHEPDPEPAPEPNAGE